VDSTRLLIRRPVAAVVAALLAAALVAGCAGQGPVGRAPAAVVDGEVIDQSTVTDLLEAQRRYYESLDDPAAAERMEAFLGAGADSFAMPEAARSLESWINFSIARQHLARAKRPVTAADRDAARSEIEAQLQTQQIPLESIDAELLEFTVESSGPTSGLGRLGAANVAADDDDRDARLRALFEELAPQRPLCLDIIVSESEGDAQAALARVRGGEDFGVVASEVSADPTTAAAGGYAGCATSEQASQAFGGDYTDAAVGDLSGPTPQNDVWVIVRIGSTTGPTLEQMMPELEAQLGAEDEQAVTTRLAELVVGAEVTVDPRYGTWDPETGTVTPPPAGTTTTTAGPVVAGP
jgi:hypothetical protein